MIDSLLDILACVVRRANLGQQAAAGNSQMRVVRKYSAPRKPTNSLKNNHLLMREPTRAAMRKATEKVCA
jgi:hypothetical protein